MSMKTLSYHSKYIAFILVLFSISCDKKYERPDEFYIDLFKNEENEQQARTYTSQEAANKSLLVIKTDSILLTDQLKIDNRKINIYTINSGKILKKPKDSIIFPIRFISDYAVKNNSPLDSATVYMISPQSYRLLITDLNISYQTLPLAPGSK